MLRGCQLRYCTGRQMAFACLYWNEKRFRFLAAELITDEPTPQIAVDTPDYRRRQAGRLRCGRKKVKCSYPFDGVSRYTSETSSGGCDRHRMALAAPFIITIKANFVFSYSRRFYSCWLLKVVLVFGKLGRFASRFFSEVQETMTDQLSEFVTSRLTATTASLHRGHMGLSGGGNGKLKNFVKSSNSLRRGSLDPGLTVLEIELCWKLNHGTLFDSISTLLYQWTQTALKFFLRALRKITNMAYPRLQCAWNSLKWYCDPRMN